MKFRKPASAATSADRGKNYILLLLTMIVLNGIFMNSFRWPAWSGYAKRIVVMFLLVAFGVLGFPVLVVKNRTANEKVTRFRNGTAELFHTLIRKRVKVLGVLALYILMALLGVNIGKLCAGAEYNSHIGIVIVASLYVVLTVILLWKTCERKPHVLFFAIAMIMGIAYIRIAPGELASSWDDQIHYERALNVANALNGVMYTADEKIIADTGSVPTRFTRQEQEEFHEKINKYYEKKTCHYYYPNKLSLWSVSYIPAAAGIVLGRGLNLPYFEILKLGRFFSLLFYALVIAAAIKKIPYGKVLLACIGLIPTSVFLASSYSYDFWMVCLGMYGYAVFFSILQQPGHKVQGGELFAMLGSTVLGFIPKMVYFPLLFPYWFIPQNRFENRKEQKKFRIWVILSVIILFISFFCGFWEPDPRGGADVNPARQVKFILGNPLRYLSILFGFLIPGYLSPGRLDVSFEDYAYLGGGLTYGIIIILLFVLAYLDRGECSQEGMRKIRITGALSLILTVLIVPTALYISYTSVGDTTILGCQVRYLYPLLMPFFTFLGRDKIAYKGNRSLMTGFAMAIPALLFLKDIGVLIAALY